MTQPKDINAEATFVFQLAGEQVIQRMESLLAWRSPNDKPMGHIVVDRDNAQQLVNAWRNIFGPAVHSKPDAAAKSAEPKAELKP